jgi:hypothetical protein
LILVDSSVWIDFLKASPGPAGSELRRMIAEEEPIGLTGIVVTEILQGLTRDVERIEQLLSLYELLEPRGFETYRQAAALYRLCRTQGLTLTTCDTLIAAIALEHKAVVFSTDRDFTKIARVAPLRLYRAS